MGNWKELIDVQKKQLSLDIRNRAFLTKEYVWLDQGISWLCANTFIEKQNWQIQ